MLGVISYEYICDVSMLTTIPSSCLFSSFFPYIANIKIRTDDISCKSLCDPKLHFHPTDFYEILCCVFGHV